LQDSLNEEHQMLLADPTTAMKERQNAQLEKYFAFAFKKFLLKIYDFRFNEVCLSCYLIFNLPYSKSWHFMF
jgi:hypothetical protein